MMLNFTLALLLLLFACDASATQEQAKVASELPLARLEGTWAGTGQFQGKAAAYQMKWERVLAGKFLRLSLRVEAKESRQPVFEGHAYYQSVGAAAYEARWFDSEGHSYQVNAQQAGDTLTALWSGPGKVEGKSTYRLLEAGQKLEVVDAYRVQAGPWKEFGRFVLSRASD